MAKKPQLKEATILAYQSGPNHWTCIDKLYKGKIPKKDNPQNTFIELSGVVKGNYFWFSEPLQMDDGSLMQYWPLGENK